MKHLRLFLALTLFNSLAIDASTNHRDDILAGQSKKDTLTILNSYLDHERKIRKDCTNELTKIRQILKKNPSKEKFQRDLSRNNRDFREVLRKDNLELTKWLSRMEYLHRVALLKDDQKFEDSQNFIEEQKRIYHARKSQHFEEYFSKAVKYLAEDKN